MNTNIADITAFRDAGGKLLTWHGLVNQNAPPNGITYYRTLVEGIMGRNERINEWYRVFFAPGVGHCASSESHGLDLFLRLCSGWRKESSRKLSPLSMWMQKARN